ncbi:uncharacterized protein F5891DRAFT_1194655 [Suillus fuscotomentosus]|uniref:Uncharacterized protein n=1 Tax=Suillus fuscotomentosus TaxID=1912939 RepID=A0AAD4DWU2_9AGAM|nr:uncharacterized protein F5891DRAFT_1194655 [Suillus fuscotomentosus]KAG1894991.1 hypothetical protein F5891DRAFT_1194655 [Suillus fuscotomentosus]
MSDFATGYDNQSSGNTDEFQGTVACEKDITISRSTVHSPTDAMIENFTGNDEIPVEITEQPRHDASLSPSVEPASFNCGYDDDSDISMSEPLPATLIMTVKIPAQKVADPSKPMRLPFVHYNAAGYLQHDFSPRSSLGPSPSDQDDLPVNNYLAEISEADKVFLGYGHMLPESTFKTLLGPMDPRPNSAEINPSCDDDEVQSQDSSDNGTFKLSNFGPTATHCISPYSQARHSYNVVADDSLLVNLCLGYEDDDLMTTPPNLSAHPASVEPSPNITLPPNHCFHYDAKVPSSTPSDHPMHPIAMGSSPDVTSLADLNFQYEDEILPTMPSDRPLCPTVMEPSLDVVLPADLCFGYEDEAIRTTPSQHSANEAVQQLPETALPANLHFGYEDEALPPTPSSHSARPDDSESSPDAVLPSNLFFGYEHEALPTTPSDRSVWLADSEPFSDAMLPSNLFFGYEDEALPTTPLGRSVRPDDSESSPDPMLPSDLFLGYEDQDLPTTSSGCSVRPADSEPSSDAVLPSDLFCGYKDNVLATAPSDRLIRPTVVDLSPSITLPADFCLGYDNRPDPTTPAVLASHVENLAGHATQHTYLQSPRTADGVPNHDPLFADATEGITHVIEHLEVIGDHQINRFATDLASSGIGNSHKPTAEEIINARQIAMTLYAD